MNIRLDSNEFMVVANTKSGTVMAISEIAKREKELESWSRIILKEHFDVNLFPSNDMFNS